MDPMDSSLENKVPSGVLFTRVPYYLRDLNRDPNLENYPFRVV